MSDGGLIKRGAGTSITNEQHVDVVSAFHGLMRQSSISDAARYYMMTPFMSWGSAGCCDETPWVRPTEDQLRVHLLKSWPDHEVDAYMVRRAALEAEHVARAAWEASWRGRIVLGYRRVSREVVWRVGESWRVLRHGVRDEDEY